MRITGGTFKGRKLNTVRNKAVRPTKAMVREALFSILGPGFCHNKRILDLFSGSGIMALESLSRGARQVICVDSDVDSCSLIKTNFSLLGADSSAQLLHMGVSQALSYLASSGKIFDLIFLDPPYTDPEIGIKTMDDAFTARLFAPDATAVLEHRAKIDLPPSKGMTMWKQKKYGLTMLTFFRKEL
ncbi:MAG: 16S rRNA (guanine(966)-N(2))-methyltransferase RsmD [Deltaproteobacteria bacterium]|nr:16S rRNA (guanine(966)-N(2))-methyltransferase RsmD [Deltaproteobacteria bacterium]